MMTILSWSPYENIWKTAIKYRLVDYRCFEPVGNDSSQVIYVNNIDIEAVKASLIKAMFLCFLHM